METSAASKATSGGAQRLRARALAPILLLASCGSVPSQEGAASPVVAELERVIAHELASKGLPALSIALVDAGRAGPDKLAWAAGFGLADPSSARPASADTVYRVGSVSKLFTDIALMQLVERGELDLDAPLAAVLPDFAPRGDFAAPITLRRLTGHTAGLVREPPRGNYFDPSGPTLAETVASLNETALLCAPGTRTKYSNAGIAVVGRVLEVHTGVPYARLVHERVLVPLGIAEAGFEPTPAIEARLARARMWAHDGREFDAPTFELGMAPAGSMYASVRDLARFLEALLAEGEGRGGRVLAAETLRAMLEPARGPDGEPMPYGIGFSLGTLDGHRRAGHGGAIYGFATTLLFLPDEGLGVAVATSMDVANAVTDRIAKHALRLMLAARAGAELPRLVLGAELAPERAALLAGRYRAAGGERAELVARGARLTLEHGGALGVVRDHAGELLVDDRHQFGRRIAVLGADALEIAGTRFERVADERPAECPPAWRELVGEYGWDHNVLFVRERDGGLEALIEWIEFAPLRELAPDVFALPDGRGMYPLERLTFERDAAGRVVRARLGSVAFERRAALASGSTFRIEPRRPLAELRALAATPPEEPGPKRSPDLVDLARVVRDVRLEIRYASADNFLGEPVYPAPRAFLQRPVAAALAEVQRELSAQGYGLKVFDAYRPWRVTRLFWDATPDESRHFVADPSQGSRHNRGCAVDLTLVDLASGEELEMPGGYDEMSARSSPDYPGGTARQRWQRELLRSAMERHGFRVYEWEWWHFDFEGWREYPLLDASFAELDAR